MTQYEDEDEDEKYTCEVGTWNDKNFFVQVVNPDCGDMVDISCKSKEDAELLKVALIKHMDEGYPLST